MKSMYYSSMVLAALLAVSCGKPQSEEPSDPEPLAAPSDVVISRPGRGPEVDLSWTDNSTGETGFTIWLMDPDARERQELALADADATSYTITSGLTYGANYYLGVQAKAADESCNSTIAWSIFYYADLSNQPVPTFEGEAKCYPTCITASYWLDNMGTQRRKEWGLCWADHSKPTIEDNWCHGPIMQDNTTPVTQAIPNVTLEYGVTYYIRAYVKVESGVYYSDDELEAQLGAEPEAISLSWKEETVAGFPSSVKVYSTTDKLNGRNFNAWYAIADLSAGDVEFRVQSPSGLKSVADQAGSDCYVLTNGAYFGSNGDYGYTCVKGSGKGSINASRGSLYSTDEEYNIMYNCTKGVYGTDKNGVPCACWGSTGADGSLHFYDQPMPTVKGWDKYSAGTGKYPVNESGWKPYYCITAGPVLVKNGKCIVDPTVTSSKADYYLTNYEIIAFDIFGIDVKPDRTVVGTTADGKVILFVCDGRITQSQGATVFELARIMKGLGCVEAVNFDGGGSTAMIAGGRQLNYTNGGDDGTRAVSSTMGFFKK